MHQRVSAYKNRLWFYALEWDSLGHLEAFLAKFTPCMAVNHCWCIQLSQRANAPICLRLNNLTRQVKLINSEKCIRLCRECDWTYLRLPDRDFDLDLDFDERDECRLGLRRGDTDRRGELHINHMYILYTL